MAGKVACRKPSDERERSPVEESRSSEDLEPPCYSRVALRLGLMARVVAEPLRRPAPLRVDPVVVERRREESAVSPVVALVVGYWVPMAGRTELPLASPPRCEVEKAVLRDRLEAACRAREAPL
jgi:hypothetical protein